MTNTWLNDSAPKQLFKDKDLQLLMFDKRMKFHSPDGRPNDKITFSSSYYCWNFLPQQIIMEQLDMPKRKLAQRTRSEAVLPVWLRSNQKGSMITSKAQMIKVMSQCDGADTLTREEKFQVFVNVCDNMLKEGRVSKANHKRWTEIWWPVGEVAQHRFPDPSNAL